MNKKELVSVIMNCYNGERYLKKSIQSLVSQSYKNWELIFWDNCSSDRSKKILCSFSDQRIKYYKNNNHTSLYKARNDAIKKSSGKYIAFLDTDDWWRNNKLKKQITFFLNNKNSHIVYSNLHTYFQVNKKLKIYHKDLLPSGFIFNQLSKNYFMPILTLIIKKKIFKKFKFNPQYSIIGDFDLVMRLSNIYKFYSIQDSLAFYRIHKFNYSTNNYDQYLKEIIIWMKSNKKLVKKNNLYLKRLVIELRIKIFLQKIIKFKNFIQGL